MDNTFTEIKKNFGFGCMRLPMVDGEVDMEQFKQMVDLFLEEGFNYFDTAHGYLDGKSELALREGLTSRYPRDRYLLVNKLTSMYFHKEEEIRPFFENQLKWCGVDYFDVYLMHAQNAAEFEKYKKCHAYETALQLKELETHAKQSAIAMQKIATMGESLKTMGDNISNAGKKLLPVTAAVTGLGTASLTTAANFW